MSVRNLINITDLSVDEINEMIKTAEDIIENPKEYMDALQVEPSEFELIKYPERGTCLYRCGNERYLLQVIAPEYKAALFGSAGGR